MEGYLKDVKTFGGFAKRCFGIGTHLLHVVQRTSGADCIINFHSREHEVKEMPGLFAVGKRC